MNLESLTRVCVGSFASAATAGYRDVLLNLQLETKEARRLHVDTHVCELQLVLLGFARIKVCGFILSLSRRFGNVLQIMVNGLRLAEYSCIVIEVSHYAVIVPCDLQALT